MKCHAILKLLFTKLRKKYIINIYKSGNKIQFFKNSLKTQGLIKKQAKLNKF